MLIHNISSKHDRETTDCNIVSETLDGLLPIHELKLKCCFCTVFHWIAIHFLIHYLPFNIFAMCCSFSISRALNKAEAAYEWSLFVFVLSLKQWAYLKYERAILYSNGRLVGFPNSNVLHNTWTRTAQFE